MSTTTVMAPSTTPIPTSTLRRCRSVDEDGDVRDRRDDRHGPLDLDGRRLVPGDWDDGEDTIHPQRIDFNDDVDSNCDGKAETYPISSFIPGIAGPITGSAFGVTAVSKDLDGDGKNEVLSGMYKYGDFDEGAVALINGTVTKDQTSWPTEGVSIWPTDMLDGELGYSVGFAGDWDGDGVEDIVAGAPFLADSAGYAVIFSSEMTGGLHTDAHLEMTVDLGDWRCVLALGDLDEDGSRRLYRPEKTTAMATTGVPQRCLRRE